MIALATVLALVIAPLIVIATHGPGAHAIAAATAATDLTDDVAVPGHAHDHGDHHTHSEPAAGHNPADHDHPLQALPAQSPRALAPDPAQTRYARGTVIQPLTPEGPRRPPRIV